MTDIRVVGGMRPGYTVFLLIAPTAVGLIAMAKKASTPTTLVVISVVGKKILRIGDGWRVYALIQFPSS